jgi:hypothetical protein
MLAILQMRQKGKDKSKTEYLGLLINISTICYGLFRELFVWNSKLKAL